VAKSVGLCFNDSPFRRGKLDASTLDQQLDHVEREREQLAGELERLQESLRGMRSTEEQLGSAEKLLQELNGRLDNGLDFELKRQIVQTLVEEVRVDTAVEDGVKLAYVHVTYLFEEPSNGDKPNTRTCKRAARRAFHCQGTRIGRLYRWRHPSPPRCVNTTLQAGIWGVG
jgi:hypothetical protein